MVRDHPEPFRAAESECASDADKQLPHIQVACRELEAWHGADAAEREDEAETAEGDAAGDEADGA